MSKTKLAQQTVHLDGKLELAVFGPKPADGGNQPITNTLMIDTTKFPPKMKAFLVARGYGMYLASRYTPNAPDATPPSVEDAHNALLKEIEEGTFTPGRSSGPAQPSAFHEAVAQHLDLPVHVVSEQMKSFAKTQTMALRKHPEIDAKVQAILAERAKAAGDAASKAPKPALDIAGMFKAA